MQLLHVLSPTAKLTAACEQLLEVVTKASTLNWDICHVSMYVIAVS